MAMIKVIVGLEVMIIVVNKMMVIIMMIIIIKPIIMMVSEKEKLAPFADRGPAFDY